MTIRQYNMYYTKVYSKNTRKKPLRIFPNWIVHLIFV